MDPLYTPPDLFGDSDAHSGVEHVPGRVNKGKRKAEGSTSYVFQATRETESRGTIRAFGKAGKHLQFPKKSLSRPDSLSSYRHLLTRTQSPEPTILNRRLFLH